MKQLVALVTTAMALSTLAGCQQECKPNQDVECWINALSDSQRVEKAVENIREIGDKKAEPALLEAFKSNEDKPAIRERIAEIFRKWHTSEAVPALLGAIDYTVGPDKEGRRAKRTNRMNQKIASALGELGDKSAIQPLLRLMKSTKSPQVQRAAIRALGKLKAREAVGDLIALVEDSTAHKIIRMNAIFALGEIADPQAVPTLVLSLYRDKAYYFFQAGLALVKIGQPAVEPLVKTMMGQNLDAKRLVEGNMEILAGALESNAAKVLGDIGDPAAVEPLLKMVEKVENWEAETNKLLTITRLITALGSIGDPRGLPVAVKYLSKEFWDVRTICADTINKIGDRSAIKELLKHATSGEHPKTRAPLIEAIGNLGTTEQLADLRQIAEKQKDLTVQKAVKESIKRLEAYQQCQQKAQCWIGKLSDKEAAVREKAAYELGRLKSPEALDALIKIMRDPSENVRFAVIWALDKIGSKKAVPAIEKLVKEEKGSARYKVVNYNYQLLAARLSRSGS